MFFGAARAVVRPSCLRPWLPKNFNIRNLSSNTHKILPGLSTVTRSRVIHNAPIPPCAQPSSLRTSLQPLLRRFQSSQSTAPTDGLASELPVLTPPSVSGWLMFSSTLVFAIIVVGGVTRLTESGLSITEWKPITGVIPPRSDEQWMEEFEKYKATPEFKLLNSNISMQDFRRIFYMEWSHRVLGRFIGLAFVGPLAYFALRKQISRSTSLRLTGLALLLGVQGALGWYMVKSGLEELQSPKDVPRVSQYRLAAHLGTALALYVGMFGMGLAAIKDWKFGRGAKWSGLEGDLHEAVLKNPIVRSFRTKALALTCLVFLTALSGAFVAGLDAGLVYNEFPLMGGRVAPPLDELFSADYTRSPDKSDLWRNIFENPTTVQFNHRVMATTTYLSTAALWIYSLTPAVRAVLPPLTRLTTHVAFAMANVQVELGIFTLLHLVPVPLAAAHQAGSVALLTAVLHVFFTLRRPGLAARLWRQSGLMKQK